MPLTVIVGGQFGGEGKGAISAFLAREDRADVLIKSGGPNSSHTFGSCGHLFRTRMMPAGSNWGARSVYFPAGSLIHVRTLFEEIQTLNFGGRMIIDPQAGIVLDAHAAEEKADAQYEDTGSTCTGTGVAIALRSRRKLNLARDEVALRPYLGDVSSEILSDVRLGKHVLVEGAQAFGLSNYHGDYPYVTSRDTTAGAVISQIGLGPRFITGIVLVLKCFPTRNQIGHGRLENELDMDDPELHSVLCEEGGGDYTGGDRVRRVGLFDFRIAVSAVRANSPHFIALTGLDRLRKLSGHPVVKAHYHSEHEFIAEVEKRCAVPVKLCGWGPNIEDVTDRRLKERSHEMTAASGALLT